MQEDTTTTFKTVKVSNTVYTCDVEDCDFTSDHKWEADKHYGKTHAEAEYAVEGGEELLRFVSKEDFDAYTSAHEILDRHISWDEPGWYRTFTKVDSSGCGCCHEDYPHIEAALDIAYEWERQIEKKQKRLDELLKFLGEEI